MTSCITASRTCPGRCRSPPPGALTNVTLPYVEAIANKGLERALADDPALRLGVNVAAGAITCEPVAEAVGLPYTPLDQAVAI